MIPNIEPNRDGTLTVEANGGEWRLMKTIMEADRPVAVVIHNRKRILGLRQRQLLLAKSPVRHVARRQKEAEGVAGLL